MRIFCWVVCGSCAVIGVHALQALPHATTPRALRMAPLHAVPPRLRQASPIDSGIDRRKLLQAGILGSCGCAACLPSQASAFATLQQPSLTDAERWDVPRDQIKDSQFANGMACGMRDYEAAVAERKEALFRVRRR